MKTLYILHCTKYSHFFWWFWWFCLLLNIWDSSFTYLFAAEPLNFLYCWTFEIIRCCWTFGFSLLLNLWIFFTAEPLKLCPGLCICLLLNLWNLFTAEPLRLSVCFWTFEFFYCWTFEIMPWIMYLFATEPLRRFSSKQNHQNFWIHLDQLNHKNKNKN